MLPDRSVLVGQKLVKNAEIQKLKCDILSNFQTIMLNEKEAKMVLEGVIIMYQRRTTANGLLRHNYFRAKVLFRAENTQQKGYCCGLLRWYQIFCLPALFA